MIHGNHLYPDLLEAYQRAYQPYGLVLENVLKETESQEYAACTFILNNKKSIFRVAKKTPTKMGHFVTLWKRTKQGITRPYDLTDEDDIFIISTRDSNHCGQFIFPKKVLYQHGCVSANGSGGKRGMRVYSPWEKPDNAQALKTQAWQINYFVTLEPHVDHAGLQKLLEL